MMPANVSNSHVWYWQGRYSALGWLLSAYEGTRERLPDPRLPWAVDNGLYAATTGGLFWDADRYYRGLDRLLDVGAERGHAPLWAVVPDAWGDRDGTLRRWDEHAPQLARRGVRLALAVQDGMTPEDVPAEASCVFVGGSDAWRSLTLGSWQGVAETLHVGRVNGLPGLLAAERAGADSCDGTGWFRGDKIQLARLAGYLESRAQGVHA